MKKKLKIVETNGNKFQWKTINSKEEYTTRKTIRNDEKQRQTVKNNQVFRDYEELWKTNKKQWETIKSVKQCEKCKQIAKH